MQPHLTRRQFVGGSVAGLAAGLSVSWPGWSAADDVTGAWSLENEHVRYVVGPDARSQQFIDKRSGRDYCDKAGKAVLARVKKSGREFDASAARLEDGRLSLAFGDSGITAVLKATVRPQHVVLEVVSVAGGPVEELTLVDIPLTLQGTPQEPFAACALALNLRTNVNEIPRPVSRLRAMCYPRFGMVGAKVALVAAPQDRLRAALQEAVAAAEDLPHSPIGGPWALGQPINQGSYLFNFGGMTVEKADQWIKLAKSLGMTQIDFHGGSSFRFGDCRPNPQTYPEGLKSFKAVIDKLHAAGISAGLHTYAFFIDKTCPWVAPVPDPRLAKDATLTLAADLAPGAAVLHVVEPTAGLSAITGFFVRNSVTLRIDDELITYSGVAKEPPFGFTGCQRGACGTRPSAHAKGAKVHHLKECFGLFVPDPETTLLEDVAARTAETYNACGFDMMYLDALDGEDVLGGADSGWHYGSRFVYEIWKRLKKPALMEMSTFHHHLWCVRSRFCAWDHPTRSHKKFIDIHCASNADSRRMFLPGELGWWAMKSWTGPQGEPTFSDDIEYLMAKCLGTDTGFALMGIDPDNVGSVPALPRLAAIIRRYEELRHSGKAPESIKARLRVPGDEYTLAGSLAEGWHFRPVQYDRHKVESGEAWSSQWNTINRFVAQPLRVRIEALMAAGSYDVAANPTLADFTAPDQFPLSAVASGVAADLKPSKALLKVGGASGCFAATSRRQERAGAWAKLERTFNPARDLAGHQGLGLWVYGDGQGQVLNLQLRSPEHISNGIGDHYLVVDFTGWRYFELIEPEGERYADYQWPYGDIYSIYREAVNFGQVATLGLWFNHLPPGKPVACYLSPIRALPLVATKLVNPTLRVGEQMVRFPVEIPSGHYLELCTPGDCKLYGPNGELLREVAPEGAIPVLPPGRNDVRFHAQTPPGVSPRARVTVITQGEPIR
jgi:hypothetical protein